MRVPFLLCILTLILLEVFILRFKFVINYRNALLKSENAVVTLVKDPVFYGEYQILDFGSFKAGTYSKEMFRAGDILDVKSIAICDDANICNPAYRKAISIKKVGRVWYAGIMRLFLGLKGKVNEIYLKNFPSPYAELLAGMTLGIKELPGVFNENLIKTGVIHVVVVSGFNVSLVIAALFPLLLFLGRKVSLITSFLGVLAFVFLVGFEAPVIRAAVMGLIMLYGKYKGRERGVLAILFFAAFIMIFISPLIIYDLSFILSFLATLGLIVLSPVIKRYVHFKLYGLEEDLISTLSAQIMVWPIISYCFGRVSVISPLVNMLILWVVPLVTVMGFVYVAAAVVFGFLKAGFLLFLFSFVLKIPLAYFSQVVNVFSGFTFAQLTIQVTTGFLVLYYLVLATIVLWTLKKKELVLQ